MLERIADWARGVWGRVTGKRQTVAEAAGLVSAVSQGMASAITQWTRIYQERAEWLCEEVKSLGLASSIVSEIARLTTIEMKTEVVPGEGARRERADYLDAQYSAIMPQLRRQVEYAAAKGGMMFKPYVYGGSICVDFVQADMFEPLSFDASGNVTACAFMDRETRGQGVYTRIETHTLDGDEYTIRNQAYYSANGAAAGGADLGRPVALTEVDRWTDLQPEVVLPNIEAPLFAYFRMPFANNVDPTSPLGVSVFARAVGLLEEADKQYSRLLWEFESGERAIQVDIAAFNIDRHGEPILPNKRLYRALNLAGRSGGSFYEDWTPDIREEQIINGLNTILSRIEDTCGLARGTFSQAPESAAGGAKTATEIRIMRQRTYATIVDTQQALKSALEHLVWAMDKWASLHHLAPEGAYSTTFEFDDSVVSDRQAEFGERMQLVALGAMQSWEIRAWYLGEAEDVAKAAIPSGKMFPDEE